jgi:hypothetical protein
MNSEVWYVISKPLPKRLHMSRFTCPTWLRLSFMSILVASVLAIFIGTGHCAASEDTQGATDAIKDINHTLEAQSAWWKPLLPILGGAAAALLGYFIPEFMKRRNRPKFVTTIENNPRCFTPDANPNSAVWLRLEIENSGKEAAN